MNIRSYDVALFVSTVIVFVYSTFTLYRLFPSNFHRISSSQAFATIAIFSIANLIVGPVVGGICGSLFPLGDMYSPITGLLAGVWGGIIGTFLSIFTWSVYSANYRSKEE